MDKKEDFSLKLGYIPAPPQITNSEIFEKRSDLKVFKDSILNLMNKGGKAENFDYAALLKAINDWNANEGKFEGNGIGDDGGRFLLFFNYGPIGEFHLDYFDNSDTVKASFFKKGDSKPKMPFQIK